MSRSRRYTLKLYCSANCQTTHLSFFPLPFAGDAALPELRLNRRPAADRGQALPAVLRQAQEHDAAPLQRLPRRRRRLRARAGGEPRQDGAGRRHQVPHAAGHLGQRRRHLRGAAGTEKNSDFLYNAD